MGKSGIDINGLTTRLEKFEAECQKQPLDLKKANELYGELHAEFGEARTLIYTLLHKAVQREEERNAPELRGGKPPRFSRGF